MNNPVGTINGMKVFVDPKHPNEPLGTLVNYGGLKGAAPEVRATKRVSHQDQILALLKKAGPKGCNTLTLAEVSHRFSARVWDLKKKGWNILTVGLVGTDNCAYILQDQVNTVPQPDLLRAQAPAKPSEKIMEGICECGHMAAWHRPVKGGGHKCAECPCTSFSSQ